MLNEVGQQRLVREAEPSRRLSLRSNFSWTGAGNLARAGCQWDMLVVLAKLGSPEMVGRFSPALAMCALVFMFPSLQLRAVQASDTRNQYGFPNYLRLRPATTALALATIADIGAASSEAEATEAGGTTSELEASRHH